MKKFCSIALALVMLIVMLAGCGEKPKEAANPENAVTAESPETSKTNEENEQTVESGEIDTSDIKIGFIATNFGAESQARVAREFEKLCGQKNWNLVKLDSAGSIDTQSSQLENLVEMKVNAIVMAMSHPVEIKASVEKVIQSGIPLITIDSGYVDGVVADITCDNFAIGARISTYMANTLSGTGNIIIMKFDPHQGCRERAKVLSAVLSEFSDIKVLETYSVADSSSYLQDSRNAMETFAQKYRDQIDGVWCAFDEVAYQAADVFQQLGLTDAKVFGIDGNEETFRRISDGNMTATVAQPLEGMADKAIDLIDKIVVQGKSNEEAAPSKIIYIDASLVDASNVNEYLAK